MKFLLLLLFFFILTHCSKNNFVYMCGDHVCLNDKERVAYFKKTMIVEIRDANKKDFEKSSEEKRKIKAAKLEQKRKIKEEKKIKKQAKINEKIKMKELSNSKKIAKKEKKVNIKKVNKNKSLVSEQIEDNDDGILTDINLPIESNSFDEILQSIMVRNKNRSFPDINNFPE